MASNRFFKQEQETQKEVSFFEVTTWARLAEVCGEYLKKGRGVRVVGRLKQDRWTDPEGKPGSRIYVIAEHVGSSPSSRTRMGKRSPTRRKERKRLGARRRKERTRRSRKPPTSDDPPGKGSARLGRPFRSLSPGCVSFLTTFLLFVMTAL